MEYILSDSEQKQIIPERSTGLLGGILYGIGCGIGGTIFILLGIAISNAGPGVLISLILGGILIFLTALNFSELATSLPISGGGYSFGKEALGGFLAFLIGFFLWIANMVSCSFSALVFTISINNFFPFLDPYSISIGILSILFIGIVVFRTSQRATKTLIYFRNYNCTDY
jgi:amino acid transporter